MSRTELFPARGLALLLTLVLCLPACSRAPVRQDLLFSPSQGREDAGGRVSPVYEQWLLRQSMLARADDAAAAVSGTSLLFRRSASVQDTDLVLQAAPTWLAVDAAALPAKGLQSLAAALPGAVSGLWLDNACEADTAWVPEAAAAGHRQASLDLPARSGGEKALTALVRELQTRGAQCGMTAMSMATGLGPDFMLQARGSIRHRGMYLMFAVPESGWPGLPAADGPWDCRALSTETAAALTDARVLPGPLAQDQLHTDALWAVTGPVLGVDGRTRRMAYRAAGSPWRPVLFWQDSGLAARRLLTGAVVLTAGLRRQTLTGLDVTGLAGLDREAISTASDRLCPAPQALGELGRQTRRCGGWSLVTAGHDMAFMRSSLDAADFWMAPGFAEALGSALESGDAAPLAALLQELSTSGLPLQRLAFRASSPGPRPGRGDAAVERRSDAEARWRHLALALPCGLPGLAFLDGATLTGEPATLALLEPVLQARHRLQLARGALTRVLQPARGLLVLTCAAPGGGSLVTAMNVSDRPQVCPLPPVGSVTVLTPGAPAPSGAGSRLELSLKARQAVHCLVGAALTGRRQG